MKALLPLFFSMFSLPAFAQEQKALIEEVVIEKDKKKVDEIVIRKNGKEDKKIVIEFKDNTVLVNGKPLAEFNEDGITINKRNMSFGHFRMLDEINPEDIRSIDVMPGGRGMSITTKNKAFLGVRTDNATDKGALVIDVTKDSPADKAGVKEKDIIMKINDDEVSNAIGLSDVMEKYKPETEVTVHVLREGKKKEIKVKLGKRNESNVFRSFSFNGMNSDGRPRFPRLPQPPRPPSPPSPPVAPGDINITGTIDGEFDFETIMDGMNPAVMVRGMRPKIGLKIQDTEEGNGVQVLDTESETPAAMSGILKDDVITEIDDKKVNNTDEAREALKPVEGKNSYKVKVKRACKEMTFEVKIPKKLKKANL